MKDKIHFEDLTALKNVVPTVIGALLCLVFGGLIITDNAPVTYMIPAFLGITLLGIPQIKNIRRRNTIKYNNTGLTIKLVGRKTFGFQFLDLKQCSLIEKGLLLKINGMDEITLSRKQFQENSLQELNTLIQQKTTQP